MELEYFTKETDDDGNEVYKEAKDVTAKADLDKVTTDLEAKSKEYTDFITYLKDEGIELNDENKLVTVDANVDDKEVDNKDVNKVQEIDVEALSTSILNSVMTAIDKREQEKNSMQGLLKEHKLPDEYLAVLEQSSNPKETAAVLGRSLLNFVQSNASSESDNNTSAAIDSIFQDVDKQLGLKLQASN